jgi:thiamine kinase-like enzyme
MRTTRWNLLLSCFVRIVRRFFKLVWSAALNRNTRVLAASHFVSVDALILAFVALTLSLISHVPSLSGLHHAGHAAVRSHSGLLIAVILPMSREMFSPTFRARLVKAFTECFTIGSLTVTPLRRRPGSRHVFSCEFIIGDQLTGKRRSIELIGKRDTSGAAGKGAREFEAMRLIWDSGFGLDERFRIPRPVQYFPDLQLILQGKARGVKLRTYAGKGTDISLGHSRMAGLWLAKLHSLKISSSQVCTYTNEIASLRMFVAALTADQPKLAGELQQRAALLEQSFTGFQSVPATMVHGDFHPDHIFVNRDSVTVIDFERFSASDPARDLGSYIAHMRTTACFSGRELASANREIDVFLQSYFSAVPSTQESVTVSRITSYVSLSSLEALYYIASVLKVVDPNRLQIYLNCMRQSELRASESAVLPLAVRAASDWVGHMSG